MSLFKSIATFGGFTLVSRVTGFVRDMVLAYFMGASAMADAFVVAFKLPNLFRSLFAEGAFTSAFVPLFSQKLVAEGKKRSIFFAAQAMMILTVIVGLLVVLFELLMPYVVSVLAPGFHGDAGKIELATELCRITFPFLLLISIVSFQGGILNSFEKFAAPAAAPIILNLTMILSAFVFVPFMPTPAHGFALGITIAGILEMLWLHIFLKRAGVTLHPYIHLIKIMHNPEIKTLFKRIAPGVVGAGIYQINMAVDTILVSLAGAGAISWLYYANRLQQLPLGVVGAAISVALLPILSKYLKAGDIDNARTTQDKAVEYGLLLSLPAAVLLIVLAEPVVTFLFRHGRFSAVDATQTAYAVIAYSVGLPCYVMTKALMPNFFARGDTVTPVKYSFWVFVTNLTFNIILMRFFGHVGIAMATTIAAFVSLGQYIAGLQKRGYWRFKKPLLIKMLKIATACLVMGGCAHGAILAAQHYFPTYLAGSFYVFYVLAAVGTFALAIFLIMAKILHIIDFGDIIDAVRKRYGKQTAK
ncbi:MAG: murein biosynthesis integral membrane protein MurJ [Alphaproteobacteria bacterium]|nr:murein biosynthesis integral membrane protein MurJ [Alphaproteobacteria bacterium]